MSAIWAVVLLSYDSGTCEEWFKLTLSCASDRRQEEGREPRDAAFNFVYIGWSITGGDVYRRQGGRGASPTGSLGRPSYRVQVQVLTAFLWISLASSPLPQDHKYKKTKI